VQTRVYRPRALSIAITLAMSCLASSAMAAPITYGTSGITLDATYSLGNQNNNQDGMAVPPAAIFSNASGADMFLDKNDGTNSIFFHTYGFTGSPTYFGARASGQGTFAGSTRAAYSASFTNSNASELPFIFSFLVDSGQVGITGTGDGTAELILSLKITQGNTTTEIGRDHTVISKTGNVTSCQEMEANGSVLGSYMTCGGPGDSLGLGRNQTVFNVNVGAIAAQQAFTIDYEIIANVSGNLLTGTCNGYPENTGVEGNGDGYPGITLMISETCGAGEAIARSGDPFGTPLYSTNGVLNGDGVIEGQFIGRFAEVPEPGSIGLLGIAGLAALSSLRRKRRRSTS